VSPRLRLAAFAGVLGAAFLGVLLLVARSPAEVRDTVDSAGAIAPLVFVVLTVGLTCAFFPFPLIAAASGLLLGVAEGTALSIVGGTLGAVAAFLLARAGAAGAVQELAGPRLAGLQDAVSRRGFVAVLYARIVPGVPRDVANYVFGLTRVTLAEFAGATLVGIAPRAYAYAYTALGGSLGDLDSTESIVAVTLLAAMGVLGLVLVRRDLGSRRRRGDPSEGPA
jgi:uncharacterized membrane protein YdjX (TVP38/TMEM64 family)